ncbi:GNAT family N-acetyltransferase [Cryobacterium sp. GrIS_2_6]|uniref:GNAT family N-acetyltransferase n=1 Tax=Cryobacterium sp. GrIS_2_6 TaxID=3162785 RepID=UPI002DF80EA6|nr:GNAT family N-acetyltransferase [Cryobacterium psychrotolerans]MEC5149429.1 GNAT superfamily N-acetyltransferase [Cryobacterium psychrotolerans]
MAIHATLLAASDAQLRLWAPAVPPASPVYELEGPVLRVVGRTRGFVETAQDVGVRGEDLDALIRRHRDFFAARSEAVEWKTRSHDLPADLPERLEAAGFVAEERETVVIGLTGPLASAPILPDGITLRRVTTRADFERIAALQTEVWGEEHAWLADDLESSVREAGDDVVIIVAEAGDRLVSSARIEFQPGTDFAGLWGGSTLAEWRGRGVYRALVAARAQLAARRGVPYLQVDASDDSLPILLRLGFEAVTTTTPYLWTPALTESTAGYQAAGL